MASLKRGRPIRQRELLVTMVLMILVQSFLGDDHMAQRIVFIALLLAVILAAIRTLSPSPRRLAVAVSVGVASATASVLVEWYPGRTLMAAVHCGFFLVFAILVWTLLQEVFSDGPVDTQRITASVTVYLSLGLVWTFPYALIELFQPGAFELPHRAVGDGVVRPGILSDFLYFSYVSLTTVGYGDIVPVSKPARTLSILEAITGQIFLATVVARLVGLQVAGPEPTSDRDVDAIEPIQ